MTSRWPWTRRQTLLGVLDLIVAAVIFGAALGPRLAFVSSYSEPPQSEEELYNRYAVPYAKGEGTEPRDTKFPWHPLASFTHRPPGYAVFLGSIYRMAGIENFGAVRNVQARMDASSAVLVYLLATLVFGGLAGRLAGASAGLVMARYDFILMFTARLLSETLFTWLMLGALVVAVVAARRGSALLTFLAAVLMGAANITRPFLLFLLPAYFLWILIAPGRQRGDAPRSGLFAWRSRRGQAAAALLGMLLSIGSVTLRNYQFHGQFVLISTNGGYTLWNGLKNVEGLTAPEELGTEDDVKNMDLGEIATAAEFQRRAVTYLRRHPGDLIVVMRRRIRILLAAKGGYKISHVLMVTPDDERIYPWALVLAALGLFVRPRRGWHPRLLILAAIGSQVAISLAANAEVRYRVPIVPLLLILAAWAVWGSAESLARRVAFSATGARP